MISADGFLVLSRSITRLALRNTDGEVTLMAPDGTTTMDSVTYEKSTEGASYGLFESARFRWSKTLTPGSDNVFGKEPKAKKSSIPKNGYRGMLVPFSAVGNKKGIKYIWDFGDGHRSYLDTTSHRFVKIGSYEGSLTLRDGTEEVVKPFTIRIGKYPNRDIHLTELCPNPAGTDTDNEWVRIKNDDTKRIDLSGWIIASATERTKLVNHVILTDRSIEPGEEIAITHADSRFTLPNERAVIELRRPDGKAVQTIEYFQDGGAEENAVFTEIDDSTWAWSLPETGANALAPSTEMNEVDESEIEEEPNPFETGMSADPDSDRLSFEAFVTLGTPYDLALPDSLPRVLGTSDERLTSESSTSESFLDALFRILNGFATGKI
jgi:PKD repeat protein